MPAELALSAYIDNLRSELEIAMESAKNKELQFSLEKVDLEVTVEVKQEKEANGELKFKLFVFDSSIGGDVKRSSANTQTIKISLIPSAGGKKGINVSGKNRRVGG